MVEVRLGHSNVNVTYWTWDLKRGLGHLLDRGGPERHARSGTPLQVHPEQVDAGRVAVGGACKRLLVRDQVEWVLAGGLC